MIHTYSPTIRRKEMEAVLTCMVDEKIGPGDMNVKLIQTAKELIGFDGAVALRSPAIAFEYIFKALDFSKEGAVIFSALAPAYQVLTVEKLGYKVLFADVSEETGLVTVESVQEQIKEGGRLLILAESMGILPDIKAFLELGIPVVEDISQSALSSYPLDEADAAKKPAPKAASGEDKPEEEVLGRKAGMYGVYAILGMEEKDIITAGGGALLIAPNRKEWTVLKHIAEEAPFTDAMTDMNAALAYVELKEFARNEKTRQELFTLYSRAVMTGRHKTYVRADGRGSTIYSFPLVLSSGFKDAKAYAQKKNIEIRQAYEDTIMALRQQDISKKCICANSLYLRCAVFPLYPRLGQKDAAQIVKVLSTLL
ncbi:DegT/DnrJ/EryC1/StrS family aminotransferase [Treponema sp.]|uniref:DegT/DnrJ/EryC1/StrS family aminotransferase n=1 Tax=Treponema sp. TaxID=166 RepID=UPI00298DFF9E|nr:DegT/DnrJ/EryC1/StrS family aminotransferase [Treponema sp.]MCQ2241328.1 DegT/DnrJ/EryC1/StrS family aminotransferase [Treponema sp.]